MAHGRFGPRVPPCLYREEGEGGGMEKKGAAKLRPIPGWGDLYLAGSDGRIYSLHSGTPKPLRPGVGSSGYEHVMFSRNGVAHPNLVHIRIAEAFHGTRPPGAEASHRNGNQRDNRPDNLLWESRPKNLRRRYEHGTHDRGLNNSRSVMTPEQLQWVRWRISEGGTNKVVAKEVGVSTTTISRIRSGKRYAHD
jgi:hypothetical protein